MFRLKFLNHALLVMLCLVSWSYLLAYWATAPQLSAEAAGNTVLIRQAQKVYEDLIKKGGFGQDKLSCEMLKLDYSDMAQKAMLKIDETKDGEPLFTPERAEQAITDKAETFMPDAVKLSEGQLNPIFETQGSTSLASLASGQAIAACELQQYQSKQATASQFTIPYLKSGVQEIQNTVMSTVTNTVQTVLQTTKQALVKMTKQARKKFTSKAGA